MCQEIFVTNEIETYPVLTIGERWPTLREGRGNEVYFRAFPQCPEDPLRKNFGGVGIFPPPFSKGGGLFPVLLLTDRGKLCCVIRTGAPHVGSGGEISISFSEDEERSWSN